MEYTSALHLCYKLTQRLTFNILVKNKVHQCFKAIYSLPLTLT